MVKFDIDIEKIKTLLDEQPRIKRVVQDALNIDRSTMSKILTKKRKLEGGELLTFAFALEVKPFDLAIQK
jgi:L-rhamnose isomerase